MNILSQAMTIANRKKLEYAKEQEAFRSKNKLKLDKMNKLVSKMKHLISELDNKKGFHVEWNEKKFLIQKDHFYRTLAELYKNSSYIGSFIVTSSIEGQLYVAFRHERDINNTHTISNYFDWDGNVDDLVGRFSWQLANTLSIHLL
jgi:hypothetical protein